MPSRKHRQSGNMRHFWKSAWGGRTGTAYQYCFRIRKGIWECKPGGSRIFPCAGVWFRSFVERYRPDGYACSQYGAENKDLDEILQSLEAIQPKIQTSFILDSSKQLYRSGLLNKQVWKMTEMLQCHPVLALHKKKIVPAAIFLEIHRMFIKIYTRADGAMVADWSESLIYNICGLFERDERYDFRGSAKV